MNGRGTLYIVATPIGNLGDMTPRAVATLKNAALIAAEDTRTSAPLLRRFDISTSMVSYHKFNERSRAESLVAELENGRDVALISDAGTPCLSDPGHILTSLALAHGIEVVPIAGACALAAALSVCGFALDSFAFYGFFPRENARVKALLSLMTADSAPVAVLYESPKRVYRTIDSLGVSFPAGLLCVCNDLTKKFERIYRGTAGDVLASLAANQDAGKGEYTLVLQKNYTPPETSPAASLSAEGLLADAMAKRPLTLREAVDAVCAESGGKLRKNEVYAAALRLKTLFAATEESQ